MASITRRRNRDGSTSWDAMIRIVGYPTTCRSFPTKLEAELWASRIEAGARGRTLALSRDTTLADLLDEVAPRLKSKSDAAMAYWRDKLGALRLLDVTPAVIAKHRDLLTGAPTRAYKHKKTKPRSASTVRRYLADLSRVFSIAVKELRVIDHNPVASVIAPPQSRGRTRYLTSDERSTLLSACKASESCDLYTAALLSLTSGLRRGEMYRMTWRDVDLVRRWVILPRTKNGEARGIPLTHEMAALLKAKRYAAAKQLDDVRAVSDALVFPENMTRGWRTALKRCGLVNFRWHDLRHSCASLLVQNGANLSEVAALLGHKDIRMAHRYAHIGSQHTLSLVDRVMQGIAA
jgi:integrase